MIRVFSFRPEYFNQNGDQGNLEALSHFTGQTLEQSDFDSADFVLFGDASRAAMREFSEQLHGFVPGLQKRLDSGKPTLLVGSCYELFAPMLSGMPEFVFAERRSEFSETTVADIEIFGYRNTEVSTPEVFVNGGFVGTVYFGPVFAKNPELLGIVVKQLGFEVSVSQEERRWLQEIRSTISD